uniref:Uncharacterized protein n=2 Tax=Leptocylindrus aporus TaxID=1398097 RepID=A0A7S0K9Y0_9STRA|mmetsp:Transcript_722/g.932  ORF Transcript_722/g.932 Transcript_722/m.932 type:complete len:624 (+) Transcript_722:94-1965(+)|eukprot:CAMPEP_0116061264 /NCGR_PEP_ID=MMETSP0322-20121206/6975_1 /TAXON_ID=163516 /ORGANISM="Leptocylindrus danicus var. apora, Strain B651" /LENGTH=623 /DNA_ID=CAMNT_0003546177 /DNA_START=94 /DNA_END=1965 /DNA_ORIENTATION=+
MTDIFTEYESYTSYEESSLVQNWHGVPRFRGSSDVSDLVGTDNEISDYSVGLVFIPILIMTFFFCWSITIAIFTCCKHCKACKLDPSKRNETSKTLKKFYRSVFLLFCFFGVLGCLLYLLIGLPVAVDAIEKVEDGQMDVQNMLNDAYSDIETLERIGSESESTRSRLEDNLEESCNDFDAVEDAFGIDFQQIVNSLTSGLNNLEGFVTSDLDELASDFNEVIDISEDVGSFIDDVSHGFNNSVIYLIIVAVLMTCFSFVVAFEWMFNISPFSVRCISLSVLMPIFGITVFIAVIILIATTILVVVNADFCNGDTSPGNPINSIFNILEKLDIDPSSYNYRSVEYFLKDSCQGTYPLRFLEGYENDLQGAIAYSSEFNQAIGDIGVDELSRVCGNDATGLVVLSDEVEEFSAGALTDLATILDNVNGENGYLTCDTILPLYDTYIKEGVCVDLMEAWNAAFIFFTSLAIVSMVILSSSAFYEPTRKEILTLVEEGDEEREKEHAIEKSEVVDGVDGTLNLDKDDHNKAGIDNETSSEDKSVSFKAETGVCEMSVDTLDHADVVPLPAPVVPKPPPTGDSNDAITVEAVTSEKNTNQMKTKNDSKEGKFSGLDDMLELQGFVVK